jgi:cell wall assembly regulator SMI1
MSLERLNAAIRELELVVLRLPFTSGLSGIVTMFDPLNGQTVPAIADTFSPAATAWLTWRRVDDRNPVHLPAVPGVTDMSMMSLEAAAAEAPALRAAFGDSTLAPITRTGNRVALCCSGDGRLWRVPPAGALEAVADDLAWLPEAISSELVARSSSPWRRWRMGAPEVGEWERLAPATFDRPPDANRPGEVPGTGAGATDHRLAAAMRHIPTTIDAALLRAAPEGTHLVLSMRQHSSRSVVGYTKAGARWLASFPSHLRFPGLSESFAVGRVRVLDDDAAAVALNRDLQRAAATEAWWVLGRTRVALWEQPSVDVLLGRLATRSPSAQLRPPATEQAIAALETAVGAALPADARAMYGIADGQAPDAAAPAGDHRWRSVADALAGWKARPKRYGGAPAGTWSDALVPILASPTGDVLAVDVRGFYGPVGALVERTAEAPRDCRVAYESATAWLEHVVDGVTAGVTVIGKRWSGRDYHPLDPREKVTRGR